MQTCETCRFGRQPSRPHLSGWLQCHRRAPVHAGDGAGAWPLVHGESGCGEWAEAEPGAAGTPGPQRLLEMLQLQQPALRPDEPDDMPMTFDDFNSL